MNTKNNQRKNIAAIIVTYFPDYNHSEKQIKTISNQVDKVIIVDNTPIDIAKNKLSIFTTEKISIHFNQENVGLAKALNMGINIASEEGYSYIVLFDQDSLPEKDMINKLFNAMQTMNKENNNKVAGVGPSYTDVKHSKQDVFVVNRFLKLSRVKYSGENIVEVDHLITSGSLLDLKAIKKVGSMKDNLFVDYIDIEWCARAKYFGYHLYGVFDANMEHNIGDSAIKFLGKIVYSHSPSRNYYIARNGVWFMLRGKISVKRRLTEFIRLIRYMGFCIMFMHEKISQLIYISKGILHGILNKMGSLEIEK